MDVATMRQLRGLVLAWRRRPDWMRTAPINRIDNRGRRYNNYRRFSLPIFGPLYGKDAYRNLGGRCRWCRQPIDEKGQRAWHEQCVVSYWAATGNQSAVSGRLSGQYQREHGASPAVCGVWRPLWAGTGSSGCTVRCVGVWRRAAAHTGTVARQSAMALPRLPCGENWPR